MKEYFADDMHSIHQFSGVAENHLQTKDDLYSVHYGTL
jgi:hypothetical protein